MAGLEKHRKRKIDENCERTATGRAFKGNIEFPWQRILICRIYWDAEMKNYQLIGETETEGLRIIVMELNVQLFKIPGTFLQHLIYLISSGQWLDTYSLQSFSMVYGHLSFHSEMHLLTVNHCCVFAFDDKRRKKKQRKIRKRRENTFLFLSVFYTLYESRRVHRHLSVLNPHEGTLKC